MTVTTSDRSVVRNASGLPAEAGPARHHAAAEADAARHRAPASGSAGGGAGHRVSPSVVPASEAGFQSYSMFSGSRPADAVPVYRTAGHSTGTQPTVHSARGAHSAPSTPGAADTGGASASGGESARAPRRSPSQDRPVRPASAKAPGSRTPGPRPAAASGGRAASAPRPRPSGFGSGTGSRGGEPPSPGRAATGQQPAVRPRPAAAAAATPAPTGPAGPDLSTTEAELSALLLGGAPARRETKSEAQTGPQKATTATSSAPAASGRSAASNVGVTDRSRAVSPASTSSRPTASGRSSAPSASSATGGRARSAAPATRTTATPTTSGQAAPSAASAPGAARRRPVFAPGASSAPSAGTGSVGILPSSAGADASGTATYRVVVANQQVAVTAAHDAPGASRVASPARAASAPLRTTGQIPPMAPASPASSPSSRSAASAPSASAAPHRPVVTGAASAASARSASAPSSETASQPAVPARAASAPTTPGPQGREVWSRGEDLTWVTLSDASRNVQGRPSSRRDAIADSKVKRRGVPTAVKVMAIVFIVLLVVLAGLIWGLPMVLGPEFSLTNIVGSLLGSSATGASPPAGVLA